MFTCRVLAALIGLPLALGMRPTSASQTVAFNSGSQVLHGRLYKPAGAGPFRAILFNHGSAPGLLNDQAFDLIGPLFVARGWVFFAPYRRGQGLSSDAGPYIQEQIQAAQASGGEALAGVVDVYPVKPRLVKLELTRRELLRILGADVPDRDVEQILKSLGFEPVRVDSSRGSAGSLMAAWECRRPTWRSDVTREIDLIEEVARHYGLDKFPARLPADALPRLRPEAWPRPAQRAAWRRSLGRLVERLPRSSAT